MENNRKPLILLSHGITEHTGRYEHFREVMSENGIDVVLYDIQGFGKRKNEPDKSWQNDVKELISLAEMYGKDRETYLIGFSLGSFIVRCAMPYLQKPNYHFMLIGTGQRSPWVLSPVKLLMDREVRKNGYYTPTPMTRKLLFDQYNKTFKNGGTSIEWLLKDRDEQEKYLQDDEILMDIPCGYFRDMLYGMIESQKVKDDRTIINISGLEDPVGNFGKDLERLKKQYSNIENYGIPQGRHDILHDSMQDDVFSLIAAVINREQKK